MEEDTPLKGTSLIRAYHGTIYDNILSIIDKGFLPGTKFALNLQDSLDLGGPFIFYVQFPKDYVMPKVDQAQPSNKWVFQLEGKVPYMITNLVRLDRDVVPIPLGYYNPERHATPDNLCPDCGNTLRVLVGVFGREVCRACEQIFITDEHDENFDPHPWYNMGKDDNDNVIYGRWNTSTSDPRSYGSQTESEVITYNISDKGVTGDF